MGLEGLRFYDENTGIHNAKKVQISSIFSRISSKEVIMGKNSSYILREQNSGEMQSVIPVPCDDTTREVSQWKQVNLTELIWLQSFTYF